MKILVSVFFEIYIWLKYWLKNELSEQKYLQINSTFRFKKLIFMYFFGFNKYTMANKQNRKVRVKNEES